MRCLLIFSIWSESLTPLTLVPAPLNDITFFSGHFLAIGKWKAQGNVGQDCQIIVLHLSGKKGFLCYFIFVFACRVFEHRTQGRPESFLRTELAERSAHSSGVAKSGRKNSAAASKHLLHCLKRALCTEQSQSEASKDQSWIERESPEVLRLPVKDLRSWFL